MWLSDAVLAHLCAVADEPDLGQTRYRLLGTLGRGGMGAVYLAEDTALGREVAIKVAPGERLRDEARVIARLEHPGIVPVHDVGTLPDGRVFYVMKRVRGRRLDAWLADGPEPAAALRLLVRVCEAVAFAHARGVVHRDLKPSNLMVGEFGEALVLDWGIAAERERAGAAPAGTPGYMAPEQERGGAQAADPRSDVWSLGATLRFVLERLGDGAAPRPLASIVARATAADPAARYPGALDLADDLGRYLASRPVRAHREGPLERAARFAARNRVVLSLLAAYLAVRALLVLLAR